MSKTIRSPFEKAVHSHGHSQVHSQAPGQELHTESAHITGSATLWLIPVPLLPPGQINDISLQAVLPEQTREVARRLRHFVVENAKSARTILKPLLAPFPLQELAIQELNKHQSEQDWTRLMAPLEHGQDLGLMSESGCPAVADPGAMLVRQAHQRGFRVRPLVGPSSILLAVMAGGLGGQRFRFNGYLPNSPAERDQALMKLEKSSQQLAQTELWIETPYRNAAVLQAAVKTLKSPTWLSLAMDMGDVNEGVRTHTIAQWRKLLSAQPSLANELKNSMVVFSLLA